MANGLHATSNNRQLGSCNRLVVSQDKVPSTAQLTRVVSKCYALSQM